MNTQQETMAELERLASQLAQAHTEIHSYTSTYVEAVQEFRKACARKLRGPVKRAADLETEIRTLIDGNRELFASPKSRLLHGIKLGLRKQPGGLKWDEEDLVLARIRKVLKEQADTFIKTTEKPVKDALAGLPADMLKKLGIEVVGAKDVAFVATTKDDPTKLVDAILSIKDEEEG
jgi:hypothetical protein